MKVIEGGISSVTSIRASGIYAGIKNQKKDLALIVADPVSLANPPIAAGVFTKNRVCAAPVWVCREHLQDPSVQSIVVNSGNANACTGDEGMSNARQMTELTANALSIPSDQVLVCSTGVIGQQLPMDKIEAGIAEAATQLSTTGGRDTAEAIVLPTHKELLNLPPAEVMPVVAVYQFLDKRL